MKKSKFTEVQIAYPLRQSVVGTRVEDICRQMGVSQATFFAWNRIAEAKEVRCAWSYCAQKIEAARSGRRA